MPHRNALKEKLQESVLSVLPITLIVAALCIFFVPVSSGLMLSFLVGSVMIIFGMALFTLGEDLSMMQIGNQIGAKMTKSRKLWLILSLSLILGIAITVAEPDLQVLAANAPEIDSLMLVITVSVGVGLFLMLSMVRILFGIPLKWMLIVFDALVFVLSAFSDKSFLYCRVRFGRSHHRTYDRSFHNGSGRGRRLNTKRQQGKVGMASVL